MTQNNIPTEVEKTTLQVADALQAYCAWVLTHSAATPEQRRSKKTEMAGDIVRTLLTRLEEEKKKAAEEAVRKTLELFHEGANTEENFRHVLKAITSPTNK